MKTKLGKDINDKRLFIKELEKVSLSLSVWAQELLFHADWSIKDVKQSIKAAMTVCGRD